MIYFELFYVFFLIGLFTFGGGYAMIPMIQDQIVGRGWMSETQLSDFIAISETTPGPFAVNISTFIGSKTGGFLGAVCSTVGLVLPSLIIIILVALILSKFLKNRFVKGALNGVKPVIVALISATAIVFLLKMALYQGNPLFSQAMTFNRVGLTLLFTLSALAIIHKKVKKKSLNPILLLLLSAGLGIILFY